MAGSSELDLVLSRLIPEREEQVMQAKEIRPMFFEEAHAVISSMTDSRVFVLFGSLMSVDIEKLVVA